MNNYFIRNKSSVIIFLLNSFFVITGLNGQNLQWNQTDSSGYEGRLITHDGTNNIFVKLSPLFYYPYPGQIAVIKYNPQGDKLWTFLYPEIPVLGINIYSMATTPSGYTYCAGVIEPDYFDQYALVMKITPSGNLAWAHSYDVDSSAYYYSSLALDEDENVFVTGAHFYPIVSRLDSAGNFLWTQQGDSIANPGGIALDKDGNVITLAYKYPETYVISAFTQDGIFKWSTSYTSNNIYNNAALHLRTDNNNNAYFLGYVSNEPKQQVTIGRVNADGSLSWVHEDSISHIYFTDLEVDDSNNIYTCGNVQASNVLIGTSTILKLTAAGDTLFQNFYDTGGKHGNWFQNIELKNNNIYICGRAYGDTTEGFLVMKGDGNGSIIWSTSFTNGPDEDDYATDLTIDEQGNVLVTGGTQLIYLYKSPAALTLKYADTSGIATPITPLRHQEEMSVFPNPASGIISVIPQNLQGTITLIDLCGEEMLSQKISNPRTQIDVSKLPSGVYLLENKNADKTIIKKVVKE